MKRFSLFVLFLALCAFGSDFHALAAQTAPENNAAKAGELFKEAAVARRSQKFVTALDLLSQAVALDPKYAEAYSWKAYLLVRLNQPTEALAEAEKALTLDANLYSALLHQAYALKTLKRYDQALASVDKAVAVNPKPTAGYALRAEISRLMQNASACCEDLREACARGDMKACEQTGDCPQTVAEASPNTTPTVRTTPQKPAPAVPDSLKANALSNAIKSLREYASTPRPTPIITGGANSRPPKSPQRAPLPRALSEGEHPFHVGDSEGMVSGNLVKTGNSYHVEGAISSAGSDTKRFIRAKLFLALYLDGKKVDQYAVHLQRDTGTGGFSFKLDFTTDVLFNQFGIRGRSTYRLSS